MWTIIDAIKDKPKEFWMKENGRDRERERRNHIRYGKWIRTLCDTANAMQCRGIDRTSKCEQIADSLHPN